jgi:hypothetical protein
MVVDLDTPTKMAELMYILTWFAVASGSWAPGASVRVWQLTLR